MSRVVRVCHEPQVAAQRYAALGTELVAMLQISLCSEFRALTGGFHNAAEQNRTEQHDFAAESGRRLHRPCSRHFILGKLPGLTALVAASLLLAGCPNDAKEVVRSIPVGAHIECDVWAFGSVTNCHTGFGAGIPPGTPGTFGNWGSLTADDVYIDTTGTTTSLPANGTGTLSVSNSAGQLLGAATFTWVRMGTKIKLQDPSAVQNWLESYASSGAMIEYELAPVAVPRFGQFVTVTSTLVLNHEIAASASHSFVAKDPGNTNQLPSQ